MTYKELKDFLGTLSEEQLNEPAIVVNDDTSKVDELYKCEIDETEKHFTVVLHTI